MRLKGTAHFRFLNLSDELASKLQTEIPAVELDTHYKTGSNVGSIELVDTGIVVQIAEFKRKNRVPVIECDVFVSIASSKRDEVWRTPKTVNYFVNIINCPIVFSYTC